MFVSSSIGAAVGVASSLSGSTGGSGELPGAAKATPVCITKVSVWSSSSSFSEPPSGEPAGESAPPTAALVVFLLADSPVVCFEAAAGPVYGWGELRGSPPSGAPPWVTSLGWVGPPPPERVNPLDPRELLWKPFEPRELLWKPLDPDLWPLDPDLFPLDPERLESRRLYPEWPLERDPERRPLERFAALVRLLLDVSVCSTPSGRQTSSSWAALVW